MERVGRATWPAKPRGERSRAAGAAEIQGGQKIVISVNAADSSPLRTRTTILIRNPGNQERSDRIYKILQNHRCRIGFLLDHVYSVNSVSIQSGWSFVTLHWPLIIDAWRKR